jgi:hypothetical protein
MTKRTASKMGTTAELTETKVPYLRLFTNLKPPVMTADEAAENYRMLPDEDRAEITAMVIEAQYRDER